MAGAVDNSTINIVVVIIIIILIIIIQLNLVICVTCPEKLIRDDVTALFLPLSVVNVTEQQ